MITVRELREALQGVETSTSMIMHSLSAHCHDKVKTSVVIREPLSEPDRDEILRRNLGSIHNSDIALLAGLIGPRAVAVSAALPAQSFQTAFDILYSSSLPPETVVPDWRED